MTIQPELDHLNEHGWVMLRGVLSAEDVARFRALLERMRAAGLATAKAPDGNLYFDDMVRHEPEILDLVYHPRVAPFLDHHFGDLLQLRHIRGHINEGVYEQTWHQDVRKDWKKVAAFTGLQRQPLLQSTFYLNDNVATEGGIAFVEGGHQLEPPGLDERWGYDQYGQAKETPFFKWAERQPRAAVQPKAGDCVLFYSQTPHRGWQRIATPSRMFIVVIYQFSLDSSSFRHVPPDIQRAIERRGRPELAKIV